jgi:molybdenum cofactor sulfurtransferase
LKLAGHSTLVDFKVRVIGAYRAGDNNKVTRLACKDAPPKSVLYCTVAQVCNLFLDTSYILRNVGLILLLGVYIEHYKHTYTALCLFATLGLNKKYKLLCNSVIVSRYCDLNLDQDGDIGYSPFHSHHIQSRVLRRCGYHSGERVSFAQWYDQSVPRFTSSFQALELTYSCHNYTETTYLDHAGTTPYAQSMIEKFSRDLASNLFGNPHSMSLSSQLSTQRTDDVRVRILQFFNADPNEFDLVFVANATAGIKLVADSLRDSDHRGFWYGYHIDAHTSLVGVRELAEMGYQCFQSDNEMEVGISDLAGNQSKAPRLIAYPAQSNMNGRRLPIRWCEKVRSAALRSGGNVYSLLDAASLVATAPLDLGPSSSAPDFTVLSFYKIFGFPDLGALIVRKSAARVFERRRYFGGGTVDMVVATGAHWHAKKETSIHERLEDGTLPFHSIIALDAALDTHERLYGSMANISAHTGFLAKHVYDRLSSLAHFNETNVCQIYQSSSSTYGDPQTQGPIIAFNLRNSRGEWVPKTEVEKLATVQNLQIRTGSVCNPGGTASSLGWTGPELRRHYSTGLRCGDSHDVLGGRPTGILRVSLGAMTNMKDIDSLVNFIEEFYVEKIPPIVCLDPLGGDNEVVAPHFYVESLAVFPIKSCGAFKIPEGKRWEVKREGLAWDREWCLIHQGTGAALNQKRCVFIKIHSP